MLPDYYQILEIPENASLDAIKQAYRKKALQCHPDRAGSHEKMLAINEAFEVLSDPSPRQTYDYARRHERDVLAQEEAERMAEKARAQAGNYPRKWADFDAWLNEDFQNARYGKCKMGVLEVPTSEGSATAGIFIILGGIAGAACFLLFFSHRTGPFGESVSLPLGALFWGIAFFGCGGAWIGRWLHGLIGAQMKVSTQDSPPATQTPIPPQSSPFENQPPKEIQEYNVTTCPKCGQGLRTPNIRKTIRITCPSCSSAFEHTNS